MITAGEHPLKQPPWIFLASSLIALILALSATAQQTGVSESVRTLIQKAGDADDDSARLSILNELRKNPSLDGPLHADLDRLISVVSRWVQAMPLVFFKREIYKQGDYDFGIARESPLFPLTYLYRGRMLAWVILESDGWGKPNVKRIYLDNARGLFEQYARAFPANRIARMYLGEPIPSDRTIPPLPDAPEWAVHQRECLERLADIIEWWVDHRMRPNAEFGGGWGDDCEMWRVWVPILIGFDSPKISKAQARFSEAMMSQPHMKFGYTIHMSDVEHTAEDSADVITPMMHIDPDNEAWRRRALRLAELMDSLWTGKNDRGFLQFKSTYFTAEKVDTSSQRACDTVYHPRTVQPALLYWQRTGEAKLTRLFSAWMDTWVDATARSERGKPAGIIPSAIHWPDGGIGGLGPDWWDPRNHSETTLYLWPSAMDMMVHTLLLTYHMTGQAKYLEPIRSMAKARLKYIEHPVNDPQPGTEAWCAARLQRLSSVLQKYRFLTRSKEFDDLLARDMSPYMRFRTQGRREKLVVALRETAEALRVNFSGYTSEVRYTDRLLRFPGLFQKDWMLEPRSTIREPDTPLLYSSATGDPGSAGYFPLNAVRWLTPPRDLAAFVTDSGRDRFVAELFHFGQDKRPLSAELYLLEPGNYTLTLSLPKGSSSPPYKGESLIVKGPRTRISLELPPQKLVSLTVSPRQ